MTYLTDIQIAQLLKAINPKRVGKDGKGFSHVESYEIRAHLNRIFGFARWSADVLSQELIFETSEERTKRSGGDRYTAWTVCYRTIMRLTVSAPDGTTLATYTEGATGEATNQPGRGDAHDLSLKTSESQALKRCAMNLGDQFGLSLWGKGSLAALVKQTLITPDAQPAVDAVDSHVESTPPEDTAPAEPADEPRTTTATTASAPERAIEIRDELVRGPHKAEDKADPRKWLTGLMREATAARVLAARVTDADGQDVALKLLLEGALKKVAA